MHILFLNICMRILFSTYETIRHPIKHISMWIVILVAFVIHENIVIELKGENMFLMSAGLVSIMTFKRKLIHINNFSEKIKTDGQKRFGNFISEKCCRIMNDLR